MTVPTAVRATPAMRIAMFSESYLPRISGVVHSLEAFTSELRAEGHRVIVVAPRVPGYHDGDPDVIRCLSVRTPQADFPIGVPYGPRVWATLLALEVDIVHTHGPFVMGAAAARFARHRSLPLVFTHHTLYDEYVHYAPGPAWLLRPVVRRYVARYANRCDCVIAPSRALAARLRAQEVVSRIEVLSTAALDPHSLASLDPSWVRPAFSLPPGRPLLVTASRMAREKSVHLVLHAFAGIVGHHDAVLLVVGGGPEEPALRRLAGDLGLGSRIVFTGQMAHRKALECMAAADVFVFGSPTETQGLVIVEAQAVGLPAVAVDAGGVADVVRDGLTGYLVPASPAALAEKVVHLLDNTVLRMTMAARAKEAAQEYAVPALTRRLVDLYQSLVPVRRR